jgi:hypothetical protein
MLRLSLITLFVLSSIGFYSDCLSVQLPNSPAPISGYCSHMRKIKMPARRLAIPHSKPSLDDIVLQAPRKPVDGCSVCHGHGCGSCQGIAPRAHALKLSAMSALTTVARVMNLLSPVSLL